MSIDYASDIRGTPVLHEQVEYCAECDTDRPHEVTLAHEKIETPSPRQDGEYRDPYRVTRCIACGTVESKRAAGAH